MNHEEGGETLQRPLDVVIAAWKAGAKGEDWTQEKLDGAWNAAIANVTRTDLADAAVELALREGRRMGPLWPYDESVCEVLWRRLWAAGLGIEDRDAQGRHPLYEGAHHAFHPSQTVIRYMVRHNGEEIPGQLEEQQAGRNFDLAMILGVRSNAPADNLVWGIRAVETARKGIEAQYEPDETANGEEDASWQRGMARGLAHALVEGHGPGPHGPKMVLRRVLVAEGPLMGRTLFGAALADTLVERMREEDGEVVRKALTALEAVLRYGAEVRMPTGAPGDVGGAYARAKAGADAGNADCERAAARMGYYDPTVDEPS